MKSNVLLIATAMFLLNCLQTQAQSTKSDKKILIVYFTMPETDGVDTSSGASRIIVPFCTHGGSRFSQAIRTITELEKGAKILNGYSVSRDNVGEAKSEVITWLQKIGFK